MSNIVPFNGEEYSPKQRRKDRIWKKIRVRIYTIILILLLVVGAAFAYFSYEKNKIFSHYDIVETIVFSPSEGARLQSFNGNVLSYSKDGAGSIDAHGNLLWNCTFDMQNPICSQCNGMIAFADYGGSKIYIQSEEGDSYELTTDMPIRKVSVSAKGTVAAVLDDVGVTWIYLYNLNGDTVAYFKTTMEESGYPVDIDISPSGKLVAVSYYYLDVLDVKSSVAFFNFGEVGKNSIDNYVSGYNYKDSLVPLVRFISDDCAFALSEERLAVYGDNEKPVSIMDAFITDEVLSVYYDEHYIGLVVRNSDGGGEYRLVIYSDKGEIVSERSFDFDYSNVVFGNDQYILYGNTEVIVSDVNGKTKTELEYEKPIRLMLPTASNSKYVVVTESTIDTIQMK